MEDGRQRPKSERQRLIASVVTRRRVGTQQELLAALAQAGVHATQATISRDIRELGLEKQQDPVGRLRYVLPGRRRNDPDAALTSLLRQFGRSAVAAQNVVVLQSELGSAPAIARALDTLGHPRIVGTLAGDDTVLIVTPDTRRARELAADLGSRIG
ncbi:MAG: arginine repressor [Gaiellaceae bacterium]